VHREHALNRRVEVVAAFQRPNREGCEVGISTFAVTGGVDTVVSNISTAAHVASGSVVLDVHDSELAFAGFVPPWDQF
jgi:hypothetical protein